MPSQMEDYQVLNTIGWGSYGECQKILRKSDEKVLVWKVLDYGTMTEAEKQKLVSEVNLLRELKHPNIVRYYDRIIDRSNATLYIVMEYCEGGDLANLIASYRRDRHFFDEVFVMRVFRQLLLALRECHRRSYGGRTVLHRDLKPANVFLDAQRNVKLGDFGLARILQHDNSFAKTFVGTPYYMSPDVAKSIQCLPVEDTEQFCCMSYNEKSDIWSLGCLLYELCSLMPPFTGSNQKQLAEKIKEGRFKKIPLHFSDELNHVISRMLHLKDYLRPSIEQLLQCDSLAEHAEEAEGLQMSPDGVCCSSPLRDVPDEKYRLCEDDRSVLQKKEDRLLARELAMREREERLKQREKELCTREKLAKETLKRAELLLKQFELNTMLGLREHPHQGMKNGFGTEKKVHFAPGKENEYTEDVRQRSKGRRQVPNGGCHLLLGEGSQLHTRCGNLHNLR